MRPCHLYRCYDAKGRLLYVGISFSTLRRFSDHKTKSSWSHKVAKIDIEVFPDRASALSAERVVIMNEGPKFNISGVPKERAVIEQVHQAKADLEKKRRQMEKETFINRIYIDALRYHLDVMSHIHMIRLVGS